ncbi:hypothetical protein Hanom_Chr03g00279521 [Helianthus anomalus]
MILMMLNINRRCTMNEFQSCFSTFPQIVCASHTHIQESASLRFQFDDNLSTVKWRRPIPS